MDNDEITLYERIGGSQKVKELVNAFYDRVLADPELFPFFENTSMDRLRRMQMEFFAAALDGPGTASDIELARIHHGRGITQRSFHCFVERLLETLESVGIDEREQMEVIRRISTYVNEITGEVGTDT